MTEDRVPVTVKSLEKGISDPHNTMFFFYVVLHQVFLSPGNIAVWKQIFKQLSKLCTLAKFLAPPTELKERRFAVTGQKPRGQNSKQHSFA